MKLYLKFLLILILTVATSALHAQRQGQALVDSLEKQLENTQISDNNKVDIMTTLCFEYREILPIKGIEYGLKADSIARQINYNEKLGEIYLGLCYCYTFYNDNAKTYEYGLMAVKYSREYRNDNIALICEMKSYTNDPALDGKRQKELFDSCLRRLNTCKDTTWYIKTVGGLGNCYKEISDYKCGDSLIHIALDLARKTNRQFLVYHNLERVGEMFYHYDKFDSAIKTFQNVNAYLVSIGDKRLRSECEHLLARSLLVTYKSTRDHATLIEAKKHAMVSYELSTTIGYAVQKLLDYSTLKEIALEQGDKDTANFYLEKSQALSDSLYGSNAVARLEKVTIAKIDEIAAGELKMKDIKLQKQKEVDRYFLAIVILSVAFSGMIFRNYRKQKSTNGLLTKEKQKSEQLLLNILPSEVAEELKENGSAKAKHYDNVTVLFTDFIDFTDAGERMDPQGLIDELHACFKAFDEIMGKYGIEKIKTIGDAYLAVAGLPSPDPKHAEHVVMAAKEISAFMQDRLAKLGETTFEIRIGIHSGSVVAGIVGVKKFAYDIWGDTVNTAARMEQNSESGKINISQTTYELVKDKFTCEYRGEIDAKGKGHLKMYYVA